MFLMHLPWFDIHVFSFQLVHDKEVNAEDEQVFLMKQQVCVFVYILDHTVLEFLSCLQFHVISSSKDAH